MKTKIGSNGESRALPNCETNSIQLLAKSSRTRIQNLVVPPRGSSKVPLLGLKYVGHWAAVGFLISNLQKKSMGKMNDIEINVVIKTYKSMLIRQNE